MSLTVSSIAQDVSYDIRQVLGVTGSDLTILTGYIDRIHKDCLHSSLYSYLNIGTQIVTTGSGTTTYTLTGNIRRILGVYDLTRERILFSIDRATSPISQVEKQEPQPGQQGGYNAKFTQSQSAMSLQTSQPEYFRLIGTNTLRLYPTPKQTLQLSVAYEQQVVTLVNPGDVLVIPEDGRDMVVAGVNYLANMFVKRAEDASTWAQIYEKLKTGASLV